tara:strand:- start:985 stop:1227 length:243 start_codon:yes stop_codon:yes gene_type:complete
MATPEGTITATITFCDLNADLDIDIDLSLLGLDKDDIKENDESTIHQALYDLLSQTSKDIEDYEIHLEEEDEDEDEGEED